VLFYTGLPTYAILKIVFNFISPFVERKPTVLSIFQEFILVLIKLRLNVPMQDLSYRFFVSVSTVSRNLVHGLTLWTDD